MSTTHTLIQFASILQYLRWKFSEDRETVIVILQKMKADCSSNKSFTEVLDKKITMLNTQGGNCHDYAHSIKYVCTLRESFEVDQATMTYIDTLINKINKNNRKTVMESEGEVSWWVIDDQN